MLKKYTNIKKSLLSRQQSINESVGARKMGKSMISEYGHTPHFIKFFWMMEDFLAYLGEYDMDQAIKEFETNEPIRPHMFSWNMVVDNIKSGKKKDFLDLMTGIDILHTTGFKEVDVSKFKNAKYVQFAHMDGASVLIVDRLGIFN